MRKLQWFRRYTLTIWLVLAAGALTGIVAYAAYTSTHTAKSVIATRKGAGAPFSSNYLMIGGATKHTVSINKDSADPTINVTVCNYPQNNPAKYCTDEIRYDLVATLVDADGVPYQADSFEGEWYSGFSVALGDAVRTFTESLTLTFADQALAAYTQATHTYALHYPRSQLQEKNVFIRLEAKPKTTKNGIAELSRYLGISAKTVEGLTGWSGSFSDNTSVPPAEYDGFNYQISGSGQAEITLKWNTEYVNISRWFLEDLGMLNAVRTDSANEKIRYIVFTVDSSVVNNYSIQFYRTGKADAEKEQWDDGILVYGDEKIPFVMFASQAAGTPVQTTTAG